MAGKIFFKGSVKINRIIEKLQYRKRKEKEKYLNIE